MSNLFRLKEYLADPVEAVSVVVGFVISKDPSGHSLEDALYLVIKKLTLRLHPEAAAPQMEINEDADSGTDHKNEKFVEDQPDIGRMFTQKMCHEHRDRDYCALPLKLEADDHKNKNISAEGVDIVSHQPETADRNYHCGKICTQSLQRRKDCLLFSILNAQNSD